MKLENEFDVVISGIGGRYAKANNLEEFKNYLLKNETLAGARWEEGELGVTNVVGACNGIEYFDTSYFGIHREQCNYMDPMQRLVIESTFEALIDAGVSPAEIRGKKVAVYTGSSVGENDNLFYESIVSGFGVTGHSRSMMSNRVSYWLNLKGPSCAYDANWLNGIEVLQAAYDSIRQGHCEAAIVATSNLNLHSEISWLYNDMGLLSPDGTTKPFDADANGYGRADGTVVLLIQRASDAKRAYASILGICSQYNGNQEGPYRSIDTNAMQEFMDEFYSNIKVNPRDVEFVECYGCGVKEVDEAELNAIDKVYCKDRLNPLLVGSVKPNTGHGEASSIFLSLAKVLIAMEAGIIPATLNYKNPNPNIPALVNGKIEVVAQNKEWSSGLAAINGIGLSSSYGHILLKGNPKIKKGKVDDLPRLVPVSTRTEEGIQDILNLLKTQTDVDPEYAGLIQDTFKRGISGHLYRGYAVLDGTEDVKIESDFYPGNKRPIWFVYSGMGSQWCKMGCDLMKLPLFAQSIHKCHKILEPKGVDLLKIVTEDDEKMFDNILHSFVGIAAMQIALTDVLTALDIVPDGIIGHSVGELGCAYADGCLSAEQMILSAYSRGKASLDATLIKGMMAAVGMGYQQIKDKCPPTIEVACHNGPDSSTISGPTEDMEVFVEDLKSKNVFARLVNVADIAYHSKYIKPAAPLLLKYLKEVIPNPLPRSSKWVSTSIPEENWDSDLAKTSSAEYHTNNLLSSVLFEEGSKHVPKEAILIEIAPHGLLQAILKRSIKGNCTNIPLTLKSNKSGLNFLLSALGKLYLTGVDLNLPAIYPKIEYPISRGTKTLSNLIHWEHGEKWRCGLEDKKNFVSSTRSITISLKKEEFRGLIGHQIKNTVIVPTSVYLSAVYGVFSDLKVNPTAEVVFENLQFKKVLFAPKHGSVTLYVMIQRGTGYFEISVEKEMILTGSIRSPENEKLFANVSDFKASENSVQLSGSDVYSEFNHRGHKYGVGYKYIKNLVLTEEGSISTTQWSNSWPNFLDAMIQQSLFQKGERYQNALKLNSIQKIAFSPEALPKEADELQVSYDYATEIISTKGIQIIGVIAKPVIFDHQFTSLNSLDLVPLSNKTYKSIDNALAVGLQVVLDDYDLYTDSAMIVEIESKNSSFKKSIQNVLQKYYNLHANVSTVSDASLILIPQTESLFAVLNDTVNDNCIKFLLSTHAFLFLQTNAQLLSHPDITQIVEFTVNGTSYSLVRKCKLHEPAVVYIKGDILTGKDLSKEGLQWASTVKSTLNTEPDKKIYLVTSITPTEGIANFVSEVQSVLNTKNIRFVFTFDKKYSEFNANQSLFKQIIKNDLKVTVIKDGSLYSIISLSMELVNDLTLAHQSESNVVNNTQIEYVGINLLDETITSKKSIKPKLGNVDYSGTTQSGQKVMGLARLDEENCKLVPDPILSWSFPARWNLEDAATIPHAHAMAYYTLFHLGNLKSHENVLIHGAASALGIAALSVAFSVGCNVYATVTSNTQKAYLIKLYKFLGDRNVYSCRDSSFEPRLMMASGGVGAHVILNCVSGNLLNATLRCVAEFGRFLQIGKLDLEENNEIGMSIFLKNVGFIGVSPENIFDAPVEIKQKLHDLVEQGIEDVVVRPLTRKLGQFEDMDANLRALQAENNIGKVVLKLSDDLSFKKLNANSAAQYLCNPKYSYLVYGGTSEIWTDVVEWLVFRGARKIVVSTESKSQQAHINRRLTLLQNYFNAEIILASAKAQTRDSAAELISEVNSLGHIGAILVLPNKNSNIKNSEIKAIQYLDLALRNKAPKALLVNFLSSAAGVCQQRTDSGFLTNHVQWPSTLDFSLVLHSLDGILRYKVGYVLIDDIQNKDDVLETTQSLYKKLTYLLPNSIDTIKKDVAIASLKPDFIQLPTLCPKVVRDLPPLFVIPGLFGRNAVKDLASQLLHPVYCANYPTSTLSFNKLASELVEKIKEICPQGPYNIIGISYGGPLAIEIVKLLEKNHLRTQLFLVDGAPHTIQGIIQNLGEGTNSEIGFLCRILSLTNPQIVKELSNLSDWNSRVQCVLKYYECSPEDKLFLNENLTTFKNYLNSILAIQPPQELILAPITLLRPFGASKDDVCELPKYFKEIIDIYVINGNHSSILKEKVLANTINNKVLC